jgi:acyl transferase domain-containing protein
MDSTTIINTTNHPPLVMMFTGQGVQYPGMGRQLYEMNETFRTALDACDGYLRPFLERPLLEVLFAEDETIANLVHETAYTQPALFSVEYALAQLWLSWGVRPAVVMGHSVGEYVAATIAGVFSLADGLKLIAERGRQMQALPHGGSMAAVFAEEARVAAAIAPYADEVSIAAINGPTNVVISGAGTAVAAILTTFKEEGVRARELVVSHAFHSPLMAPMLAGFEAVARTVTYHPPQIPLISNVTGQVVDDRVQTAVYWRDHVREAVRFADAVQTAHQMGIDHFLEAGPNPVLIGMAKRILPRGTGVWLPSLKQGSDDWEMLQESRHQMNLVSSKEKSAEAD